MTDCTVIQVYNNDTVIVQDDCDATIIREIGLDETITIPSDDAIVIVAVDNEVVTNETLITEIIESCLQGPPGNDGAGLPAGKISDVLTGVPTVIDTFAVAVAQGGLWHLTVKDQVDDRSFYQQVLFTQHLGSICFTRGMALNPRLGISLTVTLASGAVTLTATSTESNNLCVSFIRVGTPF